MQRPHVLPILFLLVAASCGGDDGPGSLDVTWTFDSGDCASNNIETVRVTWSQSGGASQEKTFPCSAGRGNIGTAANGSYSIKGEGLDANGTARTESYGTTMTISGSGGIGHTADVTLHPSTSDVVVSWSVEGRPCPGSVILPYLITLYDAPAAPGEPHGKKVAETEASCADGQATIERVPPGDYQIVLDDRAISPAVKITGSITVKPGETAQISLSI